MQIPFLGGTTQPVQSENAAYAILITSGIHLDQVDCTIEAALSAGHVDCDGHLLVDQICCNGFSKLLNFSCGKLQSDFLLSPSRTSTFPSALWKF